MRILIGVDGSSYSDAALEEVGQRAWPKTIGGPHNSRIRDAFGAHDGSVGNAAGLL